MALKNSSFKKQLNEFLHPGWLTNSRSVILLSLILMITAGIRVLTIQSPAIDRTDWKEIDHIMISRNYFENGYRFLYPEVEWPAESPRATAMELPVAPFTAALFYKIFGFNVYSVRLLTLLAFVMLVLFTYKLVKRETGLLLALSAALLAGFLPLSNQFNRYLFSEPLLLLFSVMSVYFYAEWVEQKKTWQLLLFLLGFSIALSLKPTSLYLGLPLLWIHFRTYGWQIKKYLNFILAISTCLVLPIWWYVHAYHLANEHIDVFGVFGGQFGGHNKFQTIDMLSDLDWWITMYFRMKRMLLGNFGLLMITIGVVFILWLKKGRLLLSYLIAVILFFLIVAEGNLDTTYRQLTIIPPAAFFIALGSFITMTVLYQILQHFLNHQKTCKVLAILIPVALLLFWPIKRFDIYRIPNKETPVHAANWELANQIKEQAPQAEKMILAGGYTIHKGGNDLSPILYYYSGLQGWSIQQGEWKIEEIEKYIAKGADIFAATGYKREKELVTFVDFLSTQFNVLFSDAEKEQILLDLKAPK